MEFCKLIHLSDTYVRALISLCGHCFILGEISYNIFQAVLDHVDDSEDEIGYDKEVLYEEDI